MAAVSTSAASMANFESREENIVHMRNDSDQQMEKLLQSPFNARPTNDTWEAKAHSGNLPPSFTRPPEHKHTMSLPAASGLGPGIFPPHVRHSSSEMQQQQQMAQYNISKQEIVQQKLLLTQKGPLPKGWDADIDRMSGKLYYVNHREKFTTWDDPRDLLRQRHIEYQHKQQAIEREKQSILHAENELNERKRRFNDTCQKLQIEMKMLDLQQPAAGGGGGMLLMPPQQVHLRTMSQPPVSSMEPSYRYMPMDESSAAPTTSVGGGPPSVNMLDMSQQQHFDLSAATALPSIDVDSNSFNSANDSHWL